MVRGELVDEFLRVSTMSFFGELFAVVVGVLLKRDVGAASLVDDSLRIFSLIELDTLMLLDDDDGGELLPTDGVLLVFVRKRLLPLDDDDVEDVDNDDEETGFSFTLLFVFSDILWAGCYFEC